MRLLYLCLFFVCISCTAQKQVTMEQENIIIPEINNQFEKFDILNFQKNNEGKFVKKGKELIKKMTQSFGYAEHIINPESFFSITKLYFKNGFIKEKAVTFNEGSDYGIWYEFDENGKLIKEINTDKGYEFGWKDIIKYCDKNKIPLTKGYKEFDGFQTSIFKNEIDSKKVWEITYQISGDEVLKLTLDGVTGEVLKREKQEFINH